MDLENEKTQQDVSGEQNEKSREGYQPTGQYNNYSRDYHNNGGRSQRPRIHAQSSY